MEWPLVLRKLVEGVDLTSEEARASMAAIMGGEAAPSQLAAFLTGLRIKGESLDEITGFVEAVRAVAVTVETGLPVIDVVGTGGDRSGTFNISTTAAIIAAAAGANVAKHGNRSISSKCGSADLLEGLGVPIDLPPEANVQLLQQSGFAFFFAPLYHPAFRHVGPVRKELGIPTIFNFLGPLANPAGAKRQSTGVSDPRIAEKMIGVLARLGAEYAFVFYGEDGLDEVTTTGPTYIYRLRAGEVTHAEFTPEDFGVDRSAPQDLVGGDVGTNVEITRSILAGAAGPTRDAALINASPALVAAGMADGFVTGVDLARDTVDSGMAAAKLEHIIEIGRSLQTS